MKTDFCCLFHNPTDIQMSNEEHRNDQRRSVDEGCRQGAAGEHSARGASGAGNAAPGGSKPDDAARGPVGTDSGQGVYSETLDSPFWKLRRELVAKELAFIRLSGKRPEFFVVSRNKAEAAFNDAINQIWMVQVNHDGKFRYTICGYNIAIVDYPRDLVIPVNLEIFDQFLPRGLW